LALANPNLAGPDLSFLAPIVTFIAIGSCSTPYAVIFFVVYKLCTKVGSKFGLWWYIPLSGILSLAAGIYTCDLLFMPQDDAGCNEWLKLSETEEICIDQMLLNGQSHWLIGVDLFDFS